MNLLKCVPEAGDRPVSKNADPANPGAAGAVGDRPVRGNADPELSGTVRKTLTLKYPGLGGQLPGTGHSR